MRISASFPNGEICSMGLPVMLGERFHRTLVGLLDFLQSTFHTGRRDLHTIFLVKSHDTGGIVFVPILYVCGGNPLDSLPSVLVDLLGRR